MAQNYLSAFRGPDRAQIDRAAYSNALLRNQVQQLPQQNRMQDLAIQGADLELSDAQKKNAAGVLGRGFSIIATSPRTKDTARAFISSPDFQAAGKLLGLPLEQFTVADTDDDAALQQQAAAWAQALGGVGGGAMPAGVAEFEHLTRGLTPADKTRAARINLGLDSRAGQGRVTVINGVPTWTAIGDDGQPINVPLSSLSGEATAAGTIKQSEALGSGRGQAQAEREAAAPQRAERARQQITNIDNVLTQADRALANINWSTVGFLGNLSKSVPGTPAHDMQQTLLTIQANLGFDRIQQMRESSPTGGALGQVAVQELNALQASVAALAQSQSGEQFRENLLRVKQHYENWRNVILQSQQPPATQSTDFATEQEAAAAAAAGMIKPGQRITVGGVSGVWQ